MGIKIYSDKDVLTASRERISFVFDNFEKIYLAFSGGKDSSVMFHLVMDEAIKRKKKVAVMYIDFEAQYADTIKHAAEMFELYKDHIEPHWICIPMLLRNAVTNFQPRWVHLESNLASVYDWKTNGKFTTPKNQKYRDKLLFPINNLGDSDLETYSLQLWCYAIMLEEFGYPPKKNPVLFWLNPENRIEKFECLNLKKEAEAIMRDHYLSRQ